jgi:hypothetical protein
MVIIVQENEEITVIPLQRRGHKFGGVVPFRALIQALRYGERTASGTIEGQKLCEEMD